MPKFDTRITNLMQHVNLRDEVETRMNDLRICTEADFRFVVATHLHENLLKQQRHTPWRVHLELPTTNGFGLAERPDLVVSRERKLAAVMELKVFPKNAVSAEGLNRDLDKLAAWSAHKDKPVVYFVYLHRESVAPVSYPNVRWAKTSLVLCPFSIPNDVMDSYLLRWPFQNQDAIE